MVANDLVLISRPRPQADELASMLGGHGIESVISPAFRFESEVDIKLPVSLVAGEVDLLVFTSPRAVEFGLNALPEISLENASVAAIGPATAAALERHGLNPLAVAGGHHTSEDLLADPRLKERPGAAVVVTAPGGRGAIAPGLEQLGWQAVPLHVYRRINEPPRPHVGEKIIEKSAAGGRVISTWTSGQAIDTLVAGLPAAAKEAVIRGPWVVASPRLAELAGARGAGQVHVAGSADNTALVQAVLAITGR